MSQVFSRSYLQSLPEVARKKAFNYMIANFIEEVEQAARDEKTSYAFDMQRAEYRKPVPRSLCVTWPVAELILLFEETFEGCSVTYNREHNTIVIDWS